MKKNIVACIFTLFLATPAIAGTACGPFGINWKSQDGFARINGSKPESQKITFLKTKDDYNNVKIQWMLPDARSGSWLGLDFVAHNGKPILNVEVIRKNMDEPRQFWTYDCVKVK
ncbi:MULTISPECIES: hypothetical protein [Klebsiella]|nr:MULTISPECIES: hypothetical protein [Klebsiella]MCE0031957.1 hypothetical protein [Klebsiella pneumoniae]MCW9358062.1 hypothetical protein [Klebsiella pneumoniae]PLN18192.1 hypothetical protein CWM91_29845 [Klebsiella pneumoniae]PLN57816.1 hypothetical protein CWN59_12645 [Klebsiella pneumoniae]HBS6170714.1 hypothetical protein [Klebsiella pneumoniae]